MTAMLVKRAEEEQVIETLHPRPVTYTVTFNSNGGSSVTSQTVIEGDTATEPADPTKEGYVFADWLLGNEVYDFSTPVTANITLDATWEVDPGPVWDFDVTISIKTEGGSGFLHIQPKGGTYTSLPMTYGGEPYVFGIVDGGLISEYYDVLAMYDAEDETLVQDITVYPDPITEDTTIEVAVPVVPPDNP